MPPTFYAAGVNYPTHFRTAAEKAGKPVTYPKQIDIGYRAVNALIGPGEAIVVPKDSSGKVQFEGEIVVVIGKRDLTDPQTLRDAEEAVRRINQRARLLSPDWRMR